ncbi:alpha/beta family hydrolase [Labrenzia sp. CE80]|uniref:alpha/beta family hydrolase n=1 Tax=Labrenzia sp. CE80 TaxID=1788986 RepID=UPI00129B3D63|nr:alpha/beta family hydrolase [Labrenzia sp. CE80]
MSEMLWTRPETPPIATLLLAHGAGAAMDSTFMTRLANHLAEEGLAVARFEFSYMAARRTGGSKRPPPKAEKLIGEFQTALQKVLGEAEAPILIGGKSMGGRVAAMLAGGSSLPARVLGVACFGYPFHPTGKADAEWRLSPIEESKRPIQILQGERDPFGSKAEVDTRTMPEKISVHYLEDGNHDFGPRGKSPATLDGNIKEAAKTTADFARALIQDPATL